MTSLGRSGSLSQVYREHIMSNNKGRFRLGVTRSVGVWLSVGGLWLLTGCQNLPRDDGQIWSCFGLVSEDVVGGTQADSNIFFGGCSPADPGLQIVTYARASATESEVMAACDTSCAAAFTRYWQGHTDVALPLHCNTLFVSACTDPTLGANTARLAAGKNADFFSGGPADLRSALSGSINFNIDGAQDTAAASEIVDSTFAPCEGAGQSCMITLSRFDAVANRRLPRSNELHGPKDSLDAPDLPMYAHQPSELMPMGLRAGFSLKGT